jgi:hypothetical protein
MTLKDWSKRPDLTEELARLLAHPAFISALAVLTEYGLPKGILRADSANLMENNALLNAKREGYFDFLRNLRALAVPKTEKLDIDLAPWKHAGEQE